jgi:hypothetical protein
MDDGVALFFLTRVTNAGNIAGLKILRSDCNNLQVHRKITEVRAKPMQWYVRNSVFNLRSIRNFSAGALVLVAVVSYLFSF